MIPQTVSTYNFLGCYVEGNTGRALSGLTANDATSMTVELCATSCAGYSFFGVEYSDQCCTFQTNILNVFNFSDHL